MKSNILIIICCCLTVFYACSEQKPKPLNPNGDSELAILMREMHENGLEMKAQLEKGELPKIKVDYEKIKTAKETPNMKPDKMVFDLFAQSYVHTMQNLEKCTDIKQAKTLYKNMQTNCMNCHQKMCPGPIVKINQLLID